MSLTLAWWGTAWLRGSTSPDAFLDAMAEHGVRHVVAAGGDPAELLVALALQRGAGATALAGVFPAPGDPFGLAGGRDFNAAAIDASEAVLVLGGGVGWVPGAVGAAVEWEQHAANRRPPPDLGDADRGLRHGLLRAADDLARLDLARWQPDLADELIDLTRPRALHVPPGVPPRAADLAGRALRLLALTAVAPADGGALSVADAAARADALGALNRTARHALTAAAAPDGWPPA